MSAKFKIGDFVTVSDAECRSHRKAGGVANSGTVVRVEVLKSGTEYVEFRSCGQTVGCNASALSLVDVSKFRWRR